MSDRSSTTLIVPPVFRSVRRLDNSGNFSVEVEIPGQPYGREIDRVGGKRRFQLKLILDGDVISEGLYAEGGSQSVRFRYASSQRAALLGVLVDADGSESNASECRFVVRFVSSDYVLDFDTCQNVTVSNVVIEGARYGVTIRSSTALLSDCEIILHNGNDRYVTSTDDSTVTQRNVNGHTRDD